MNFEGEPAGTVIVRTQFDLYAAVLLFLGLVFASLVVPDVLKRLISGPFAITDLLIVVIAILYPLTNVVELLRGGLKIESGIVCHRKMLAWRAVANVDGLKSVALGPGAYGRAGLQGIAFYGHLDPKPGDPVVFSQFFWGGFTSAFSIDVAQLLDLQFVSFGTVTRQPGDPLFTWDQLRWMERAIPVPRWLVAAVVTLLVSLLIGAGLF